MKHVPNVLSVSRIILSPLLPFPFVLRNPWIYLIIYGTISLTDLFDGRIARRYKVESELGAKLDVFGDIVFFLCIIISLLMPPRLKVDLVKCIVTIGIAIALKLAVIIVTRVKFKVTSGTMHTYLDKGIGATQTMCIPIFIVMREIYFPVVVFIAFFLGLSAVEEIVTLLKSDEYDPNHKGYFMEKIMAKREKKAS